MSGILGKMAGGLMGQGSGGGNPIMSMVTGLLNQQGGISGLMGKFQQQGLGDIAQSWVGTGDNKPIQPDQMQKVIGEDQIQNMSRQTGMPAQGITQSLSQYLPEIINRLTPNGQMPQGPVTEDNLKSSGIGDLMGNFLGKKSA